MKMLSTKRRPLLLSGTVDFLSLAKVLTPLSVLLSFAALACAAFKGFVYGVDFAGGNEIHASFPASAEAASIRQVLKEAGFSNPFVQSIGSGGAGFLSKSHFFLRL